MGPTPESGVRFTPPQPWGWPPSFLDPIVVTLMAWRRWARADSERVEIVASRESLALLRGQRALPGLGFEV
jgi:hypothetical protein